MTDLRKLLIEARTVDDTVLMALKNIFNHRKNALQVGREVESLERLIIPHISRIDAALAEPVEPVACKWIDGCPPKPWCNEWFIAKTTFGDRVVLTALPEEYAYDFKTADDTYIKADKIVCWMQFPDSQYIAAPADQWRRVEAGLPTNKDADDRGNVLVWHESFGKTAKIRHIETVAGYREPQAASMAGAIWHPLPALPEGE